MSNSHPLHPFFTPFEPVAHPLQAVVVATVPLFFPTVSEAVHSDWSVHLLRGPERPPTIWKTSSNLLLPAANAAIEDQQHSMDVNDDLRVEEDLSGLAESAAGASSDAGKDTAAKRSRKRRREPTVKIEEKKKTGPKGKGGEGPPGWVRPLFVHDENDRLVRCSPPSSAAAAGKKAEYVTCLICHQKVSFNKYSWTTPRQHMRKHNINSPSDLETVLQLAKQCWKEGRDFPEERLPRAGDSKGRPRTRKITDYQAGGGFRPHARGTMAYSRVRRAVSLWIATDCLPYATVDTPAFRAMLRALDPQAPDLGRKSVTTQVCIRICFLLRFMFVLFHLLFLWLMLWLLLDRSHGCITQGWSG